MKNKVKIKEIFSSVQGEGPYIGYNQLFVRFSTCNLNCRYCDTDFGSNLREYTVKELSDIINAAKNVHSVSFTGGEPLIEADFLKDLLPALNKKIYLETNGTLNENLAKVIEYVDIISMDIKLNSSSNSGDLFKMHEKFIQTAIKSKKEIFLKTVFDENITEEEIEKTVYIASKYGVLLVLQPKMEEDLLSISSEKLSEIFNKFNEKYNNVRLIPQVHKFINVQ